MKEQAFAAYVGIDWADQKHDVCLQSATSQATESFTINHSPEALAQWMHKLKQRFDGRSIAVGIELQRGALINALMEYDFISIFPINPATSSKYRKAFYPSRAKSDPKDAQIHLELVTAHRDKLKPLQPDDPETRKLRILVEARRQAVNHRTRFNNALKAHLKQYFPQALSLVGDSLTTPMAGKFLLRWPSLQVLKRAKIHTIQTFYYQHNSRSPEAIAQRLEVIRTALPLTTNPVIIETAVITVTMLARLLLELDKAIKQYEAEIASLFDTHPDAFIFHSFPGAGPVFASRLVAAFGSNRDRFTAAQEIQNYSGIAPVIERSGKSCWIHYRRFCPRFLRQSFHEYANESIRHSIWARAFYAMKHQNGMAHHAIIRALAYKWIRIMFRCWKDRVPYDELAYLKVLQKTNSPVLAFITQTSLP